MYWPNIFLFPLQLILLLSPFSVFGIPLFYLGLNLIFWIKLKAESRQNDVKFADLISVNVESKQLIIV